MPQQMKTSTRNWIKQHKKRIIEISETIWEYAELGYKEYKSSELLVKELEKHGFSVNKGVADIPTAIVASWGSGNPVIGVMGEFDALPGLSQKRVPHQEPIEEGAPGHGCGHNIHGASGLGGALAAKHAMEQADSSGTLKFFGTPAEENGSGKVFMVRAGVFDDVDAVISHHPGTTNYASLKTSLANNAVKFHFHGKSSHAGGSPEAGRSALDAIELMNVGVNYLREHMIDDARIHYVIEDGGGAPNVVPDYARSWYLVRAPTRPQVDSLYERVVNIAKGAALMTETELEVELLKAISNKIPNKAINKAIMENMKEIGPPKRNEEEIEYAKKIANHISQEDKRERLRQSGRPDWEELMDKLFDRSVPEFYDEGEMMHGSTDVADVSWQAPTVEFNTATWVLGSPGHSWMNVAQGGMGIGHKSLIFASKVIATTVIDLFTNTELRENAWEEFKERTKGKTYECPVPTDVEPPLDIYADEK